MVEYSRQEEWSLPGQIDQISLFQPDWWYQLTVSVFAFDVVVVLWRRLAQDRSIQELRIRTPMATKTRMVREALWLLTVDFD